VADIVTVKVEVKGGKSLTAYEEVDNLPGDFDHGLSEKALEFGFRADAVQTALVYGVELVLADNSLRGGSVINFLT